MILVAGLTPAWQYTLLFDHFRYGEVNRAAATHWCASGKVFNAGIAVHALGGDVLTLAPVGGPAAVEIDRDFRTLGVPHRWIRTAAPTRVCTTILDRGARVTTELVENGRPLLPEERDAFRRTYAEEVSRAKLALIIGSLPAGTPDTFYRDLMALTSCPTLLDFRGPGLLDALSLRPLLVKPNREELAHTLGQSLETDAELLSAMRSLNERGAQWVLITQGARPIWLTSPERAYRFYPPTPAQVLNPIGSGDALAAGIACATCAGRAMLEAVRYGIAAATANVESLLPGRFEPAGVAQRAQQVRVEELRE